MDDTCVRILFVVLTIFMMTTIVLVGYQKQSEIDCLMEAETVTSAYFVSDEDYEYICKMVYLEAGTCSDACQRAIASVVFNQVAAGYWGGTPKDVISYGNVYTSYKYFDTVWDVPQYVKDNVDHVIRYGVTIDPTICYFRAGHGFDWENYETILVIDDVYFGHFTKPGWH